MGTVTEIGRLRERFYHEEIPGGLRVYVLPKPGFHTRYATFATRYGSNDQVFQDAEGRLRETPAGIAHFLEHKLFEDEDGNVSDRFSALGAMANAYTNYTETTYLFSTTANFRKALELLIRFVQRPYFTEESVRKEQGIIGQELRMYEDDPRVQVFQNLLEALYQHHPVRGEIGGTVESIGRITPEQLYLCHGTFYHPGNMVLFATGDVDPDEVFDLARQFASGERTQPVRRNYAEEPRDVNERIVRRAMAVGVPLLDLGFKDVPEEADPLRREVTMEILLDALFGPSSDIHRTLYEAGLISEQFSASYFADDGFAASLLGGPTPDPDRLLARLQEEVAQTVSRGLGAAEIERSRNKALGEFVALFNSPEAVAHSFSEYALRGLDLFHVLETLEDVTEEEVQRRLVQQFGSPRWSASIIDRAE